MCVGGGGVSSLAVWGSWLHLEPLAGHQKQDCRQVGLLGGDKRAGRGGGGGTLGEWMVSPWSSGYDCGVYVWS